MAFEAFSPYESYEDSDYETQEKQLDKKFGIPSEAETFDDSVLDRAESKEMNTELTGLEANKAREKEELSHEFSPEFAHLKHGIEADVSPEDMESENYKEKLRGSYYEKDSESMRA